MTAILVNNQRIQKRTRSAYTESNTKNITVSLSDYLANKVIGCNPEVGIAFAIGCSEYEFYLSMASGRR